jgi:hypothetical protein
VSTAEQGGIIVHKWLVASPPREFAVKATGEPMTIVELRNSRRLSDSLALFVEGPAGRLAAVEPSRVVAVHLDSVQGGRGRGELTARVDRDAIEAALGVAG